MVDQARTNEEQATARRASVLGFNYVDSTTLQKQLYKDILTVPELYQMRAVPLVADEHYIRFGVTTTTSQQTLTKITNRFTDQRVQFSLISDSGFNEYMKLYDPPKKVEYEDISIAPSGDATNDMLKSVSDTLAKIRPDDMLAYLVAQAHELGASDIHLENQKENVRIRLRVDGVLHPVATLSPDNYRHLLSAIASAANISTAAKGAQTGHISSTYQMATGEEVPLNLRVETVPAVFGVDVVMRLFNMDASYFRLENLGLSEKEEAVLRDIVSHPTGLVLIVGPTGSGKTTTLYSLLNSLNSPEKKIITLEDPVEYNIPGITQIPVVGTLDDQNFAEKLRAVLRLDPDVVMVGEIRDQDTAKTALQGALTGHLVLSTFHAASAAAALTRMLDMIGINPLFASAMRVIMAQRLVRRLDDKTKQAYQPDEATRQKITEVINSLPPSANKPDLTNITLYKPGSSADNPFGYSGQMALREQLMMTPGIQDLLRLPPNKITTEDLQAKAVDEGMKTMLQDGILKALAGQTTIEEIFRVVS